MSFLLVFSQPLGPLDDTRLTRSQFSLNLCQDPLHNEHTRHGRHRVHSSTQRHFIRHLKLKTKENNQTISNMILHVSLYFGKGALAWYGKLTWESAHAWILKILCYFIVWGIT